MRTLDANSRADLWAERMSLDELDVDGIGTRLRGLELVVDDLCGVSLDRVLAALECPALDRVEVGAPVGREQLCTAIALMRECRSRDIAITVSMADDVQDHAGAWTHLLTRPSGRPLRFDLYRRHGPGFVQVVDDRPNHDLRITFDDADDIEMFVRLEHPTPVTDLDVDRLEMLATFDLVVVVDEVAVLLVPRIRRWPVPIDDLFEPPVA